MGTEAPVKEAFLGWALVISSLFFFFFFLAGLGLHCCTWTFSSCGKVCGLLIPVASLVAEHGL